jgi:COMPASS component SWD3
VNVQTFVGHSSSVCDAVFNAHGNVVISGSKDCTIRVFDALSGLCVRSLSDHIGEVTSVALHSSGYYLLSCSKDNANRLWDLRMGRPVQRYKGHQNTSKNFIRATFGPSQALVLSGAEDGCVYIWCVEKAREGVCGRLSLSLLTSRDIRDRESGCFLQRLHGHRGVVYHVAWSESQSLLASSSHDGTVRCWGYDAKAPLDLESVLGTSE